MIELMPGAGACTRCKWPSEAAALISEFARVNGDAASDTYTLHNYNGSWIVEFRSRGIFQGYLKENK